MLWPLASASPVPSVTTLLAVFFTVYGVSNLTVGLALVSVLTVTAPSGPVAAPAGAVTTAAPSAPATRPATTRKRAAARSRTRDCFRRPTGGLSRYWPPG